MDPISAWNSNILSPGATHVLVVEPRHARPAHLCLGAQFRPRLEELTDAEYRWEPVAGCWSVRPTDDTDRGDGIRAIGDEGLFRPCGTTEGPDADGPFLVPVPHINREFLRHQAEVMLLYDLYRNTVTDSAGILHSTPRYRE